MDGEEKGGGVVPGTVSEGLNGWSEALTVGLAVSLSGLNR